MTESLTYPMTYAAPFGPSEPGLAMRDAALAGTGPGIARVTFPDGKSGWLVVRHRTVRTVLADPRFSARQELRSVPFKTERWPEPARPGMFIGMDPPDHTRYRRLLTGQFTVRRMKLLEARVEEIVEEVLATMTALPQPVDLVEAYARPVPAKVICELLGVPYDDHETFMHDSFLLSRLDVPQEEKMRAYGDLTAYVLGLVHRKRETPEDDLLSGLVADGHDLSDEALANMGFVLLGAGLDTTANMLGLGTFALLQNPSQIPLIRDPDTVDNAVEELLRYLPIIREGTVRTALEDVSLEGVTVRAGETVVAALPVGNRDPERFADPDRLDLGRTVSGHLAFGHGIHQCLGQQLARVEMRVGFRALFSRFPSLTLAVPPSQVPLRDDMLIYGVHELPVSFQ